MRDLTSWRELGANIKWALTTDELWLAYMQTEAVYHEDRNIPFHIVSQILIFRL